MGSWLADARRPLERAGPGGVSAGAKRPGPGGDGGRRPTLVRLGRATIHDVGEALNRRPIRRAKSLGFGVDARGGGPGGAMEVLNRGLHGFRLVSADFIFHEGQRREQGRAGGRIRAMAGASGRVADGSLQWAGKRTTHDAPRRQAAWLAHGRPRRASRDTHWPARGRRWLSRSCACGHELDLDRALPRGRPAVSLAARTPSSPRGCRSTMPGSLAQAGSLKLREKRAAPSTRPVKRRWAGPLDEASIRSRRIQLGSDRGRRSGGPSR